MASKSLSQKLKILCLHGYGQNATIFYKKAGYLRTALKNTADCEFISGPFEVQIENDAARQQLQASDQLTEPKNIENREPNQAWFRLIGTEYVGVDESLSFLREYMIKQGPFDGVLGFSQGAIMASILAAMISSSHPSINQDNILPDFKFGVFIGGFTPRDPELLKIYETKLNTPSLHVWGIKDPLIPPEKSEVLSSHYNDPVCLIHDGGHVLPTRSEYRRKIVDFINKFNVSPGSSVPEMDDFQKEIHASYR